MIHDYVCKDIDGKDINFADYKGKYILIVNVASRCGFTRQYKSLQTLYENHKDKLEIFAFPCNQFGNQEPEDNENIKEFVKRFNVDFHMMSKVEVNGENADSIFKYIRSEFGNQSIRWNFEKFLFSPEGSFLKRHLSIIDPLTIENDI